MLKLSRFAAAALLFAGAGAALAQPPGPGGPGGRPGGFEKKDFPKQREAKGGGQPNTPPEALERELQMLRARISEVEGQLKNNRPGDAKRDEQPKREEPKRDGPPMGRGGLGGGFGPGGFGPGGPMPMGGGFNPLGRGGPGGGPMGPGGFGGAGQAPFDQMSAEQIKQLIGRLQQILESKNRGGDQPKKPEGNKGDQPRKPEGNKGDQPKEDVMRRLERISKELEEIRRSLGK